MRCCAHMLNLIVQDGLNEIRGIVENIRECVKYLKCLLLNFINLLRLLDSFTINMKTFDPRCADSWNSTYKMLESAFFSKKVFENMQKGQTIEAAILEKGSSSL